MNSFKEAIFNTINTSRFGRLITGFYLLVKNHLRKSGWLNSVMSRLPQDYRRNELPWFTYGCIYFLGPRLTKEFSVFEYGSGNSTLWFCKKVGRVVSIEHDKDWHEKMKDTFSTVKNIESRYSDLPSQNYRNEILKYRNEFDIIVLDGRDRVACSMNCLEALKDTGIIIWDNSDRKEYADGYAFLLSNGFKKIDFYGMGPISVHAWCTSIFYRNDNCLQI